MCGADKQPEGSALTGLALGIACLIAFSLAQAASTRLTVSAFNAPPNMAQKSCGPTDTMSMVESASRKACARLSASPFAEVE